MIKLECFTENDCKNLISWVKNEEELMQFAGFQFVFTLTNEQIKKSLIDKNRFAFKTIETSTNKIIGHAELYLKENSFALGRILIGDKICEAKDLES